MHKFVCAHSAHAFYSTEITICSPSCVPLACAFFHCVRLSFFALTRTRTQKKNIKEFGANQKGETDGQQNALKYDLCLILFEIQDTWLTGPFVHNLTCTSVCCCEVVVSLQSAVLLQLKFKWKCHEEISIAPLVGCVHFHSICGKMPHSILQNPVKERVVRRSANIFWETISSEYFYIQYIYLMCNVNVCGSTRSNGWQFAFQNSWIKRDEQWNATRAATQYAKHWQFPFCLGLCCFRPDFLVFSGSTISHSAEKEKIQKIDKARRKCRNNTDIIAHSTNAGDTSPYRSKMNIRT